MAEHSDKSITGKRQPPGGVHAGHRQRVKERFLKEGLDHFEQHQVLEMLLFFGIPMKDTNELAHTLLDTFGGFYRVLEAPYEQLRRVKGMTDNAATLICFSMQLAKQYWLDRCDIGQIIDSAESVGELLKYRFAGEQTECVYLLSLDNRNKLLNCTCINKGSINATEITARQALRQALLDNAARVILAHNHPSGHAYPSNADLDTTKRLTRALALTGIALMDHIIVSEDDFVSLAQTTRYQDLFPVKYI